MQVHGGMGFIEETGAAQFMRDAKIAEIYEGANGIQANDLIGRKISRRRHLEDTLWRCVAPADEILGFLDKIENVHNPLEEPLPRSLSASIAVSYVETGARRGDPPTD